MHAKHPWPGHSVLENLTTRQTPCRQKFRRGISCCMCEKSHFTGQDSTHVLQRGKATEWATGPGIRPKCPCSPGLYPTLNDDHMTFVSSLTNIGVNSNGCKYQTKSFVFVELSESLKRMRYKSLF